MRILPNNDLRWPKQVSVQLTFPEESGTDSRTPKGLNVWLAWPVKPNREPGIGGTRQPAAPHAIFTTP